MHKFKLIFSLASVLAALWCSDLQAHHPAPGSYSERFIEPATRLSLATEKQHGAAGNQDLFTTTFSGEFAFVPGHLSASIAMPYVYYAQKHRKDAGRYGKPRISVNALPFSGTVLLGFTGGVGFPTGPDTDRFTEENYWEASAGAQAGLRLGDVLVAVTGGGIFPIGRTVARKKENAELPFFMKPYTITVEETPLKKVTRWSAVAVYDVTRRWSLSAGFSYQSPYMGVVYETADDPYVPRIFREASAGVSFRAGSLTLGLDYRYPLYRGRKPDLGQDLLRAYYRQRIIGHREFKKYHEAIVLSASWQFDTAEEEPEGHDHKMEPGTNEK
jgi:hypothetical protein